MQARTERCNDSSIVRIFVANVEEVLSPGGCVTGIYARKVREISARFALLGEFDIIVLPMMPSQEFLGALAGLLPRVPRVFVPSGLNKSRLSMRDGFADLELRQLLKGATVESYIHDPLLKKLVEECGGEYPMGTARSIKVANDKGQYAALVDGLVAVPSSVKRTGIRAIAAEVWRRMGVGLDAMVRLTFAGGGLGNRLFRASEWRNASLDAITVRLEGDQPDAWAEGEALIEEALDLVWSPGTAFHTSGGVLYDFLQVTEGNDYVGAWVPCPPRVARSEQLAMIGEQLAERIASVGYVGAADTDLGVAIDGTLYGFEINGRRNGVLHMVRAVEEIVALPYAEWRQRGVVMKGLDHVELQTPRSFSEIHRGLASEGLLASRECPTGTVITVPPSEEGVFGFLVIGNDGNYEAVERTYRRALKVLDARGPQEDNPLFADA